MFIPKIKEQSGGADKEAQELRQKILYSANNLYGDGTIYYFSENGDDTNDGLTPETPFKSYEHIQY